jgi:hypothetical protein
MLMPADTVTLTQISRRIGSLKQFDDGDENGKTEKTPLAVAFGRVGPCAYSAGTGLLEPFAP